MHRISGCEFLHQEVPLCVFPFVYNGVSYSNCTDVDANSLWCSTAVGPGSEYISGEYRNCYEDCDFPQS